MSCDDELYDQLEQAMAEASKSRREAFEESVRRGKAERDAIEAIRRAKAAERSYSELKRKLKEQDEILQQVQSAMESQISEFDNKVKELEKKRDDLQIELRQQNQASASSSSSTTYLPQLISEFPLAEIEEERDDLQIESPFANIVTAEELRQQNQASGRSSSRATYLPRLIPEFSLAEIEEERDDLQIESSFANIVTAEEWRQQNQASERSSSRATYLPRHISEFSIAEIEEERDDLQIESPFANIVTAEELRQQIQAAETSSRAMFLPHNISEFSIEDIEEERDDLQIDLSIANILTAEEQRPQNQAAENSSRATYLPRYISEFSLAEIEEATCNFHPSLKIGEGGYGSVYKGLLDQTEVAIKKLHSDGSLQGPSEYQLEVKVLGKLRHPNLITLIGACQEVWTLIYEYLPNGSLEDRLSCKDNSSPLSWQTRIRIAAELCSVLVFLHSNKPHSIVQGDLNPDNILLDANLVSKLSGFGKCRVISHDDSSSSSSTTVSNRTEQMGTLGYIDPEFQMTGELTPESDVYSFGIILLRLLTGRPALDLTNEVQWALDTRDLKSLLDDTAGDWPYIQAQQLAHLGLRCAEANCRNRPNLGIEVWRVLELMRATSGGGLSSLRLIQASSYFICPILMEVMQDPHVAADGYTYEAEAIRGWLDSGHDTSPMTNVELENTNLIPNLALRSVIQEWLQEQ